MAPIIRELSYYSEKFTIQICTTGQHRTMLDQVLEIFNVQPHYDFNVMQPGQQLSDLTSLVLSKMAKLLREVKPDLVLVHGDTTTAFATALACFYNNIPVGHVEAGLRTNNLSSPFPEEFNRQVVSQLARWHFAPTELNRNNLLKEKIEPDEIFVTGNTVIDSLSFVIKYLETNIDIQDKVRNKLNLAITKTFDTSKYVLVTGHRRENFGAGFVAICDALVDLSTRFPSVNFVYPVHLNPNVKKPVEQMLGTVDNIFLIPPQDYLSFVHLLKNSYLVLTDSGGIQEEAAHLGKPVVIMREVTERQEAVDAGTAVLVGAQTKAIVDAVADLLIDENLYLRMSLARNPFGDGKSAGRIVDILINAIR
jgi:UDP-N-acetylglucosamine 2-epimerase (non-hydrolysing)